MPRFAANLAFLFTEVDFLQRFDAARKAGFATRSYPSVHSGLREIHPEYD